MPTYSGLQNPLKQIMFVIFTQGIYLDHINLKN